VDPEALKALYEPLHRYAGWLDRERTSMLVRADVQALGIAIDTRADPRAPLQALETNLARLPSGELRKILRAALAKIRHALEDVER
jgi:hypothetical protein